MNSTNITNTTAVPFTPEGRPPPGFAPPGFTAETIVATVFFCILTSGIVFGNSLVIGAFYVNRRLRTTTNYFIMSLSVADMLIGSISVPLWVYFYITNDTAGNPVYEFWLTFDIICGVSSILNMTMISLERCYALLRPIQHRNISKNWIIAAVFTAWCLAALAGSMRKFTETKVYGFVVTSVFFFVPLVIIFTTYGVIFHIARKHARGRGVRSFRKDLRIATTVAVVIGLFVLCWSPFFALNFVFTLCLGSKEAFLAICAKIPPQLLSFNKWLQYGNSVCNPIIYGFRNNDFRRAFKKLLLRMCGKKVRLTHYDRSTYVRNARSAYVRSDSSFDESKSTVFPSRPPPPGMYDMRESYKKAVSNGRKKPIKIKQARRRLADGLLVLNTEAFNISGSNGCTMATLLSSSSDVTSSRSEVRPAESDVHPEICPLAHVNSACDSDDSESHARGVSALAQVSNARDTNVRQIGHVNEACESDDHTSVNSREALVCETDFTTSDVQVHFESPKGKRDTEAESGPEKDRLSSASVERKRALSDTALGVSSEDSRLRTNSSIT